MAGGDPSPNGAPTPPPPRPPSGSPFGRFLQNPVLLIGFVALLVSAPVIALALQGGGGGNATGPPVATPAATEAVIGDWAGTLGESEVALTIRGADGELTRDTPCRGTLRRRSTMGRSVAFAYRGAASRDDCPRRSTIILTVVADQRLRIDELRGDRLVARGSVTAR